MRRQRPYPTSSRPLSDTSILSRISGSTPVITRQSSRQAQRTASISGASMEILSQILHMRMLLQKKNRLFRRKRNLSLDRVFFRECGRLRRRKNSQLKMGSLYLLSSSWPPRSLMPKKTKTCFSTSRITMDLTTSTKSPRTIS